MHTKSGEPRGSRGQAMMWPKTLTPNFDAGVGTDANANANSDTEADAWASSLPLPNFDALAQGQPVGNRTLSCKTYYLQ